MHPLHHGGFAASGGGAGFFQYPADFTASFHPPSSTSSFHQQHRQQQFEFHDGGPHHYFAAERQQQHQQMMMMPVYSQQFADQHQHLQQPSFHYAMPFHNVFPHQQPHFPPPSSSLGDFSHHHQQQQQHGGQNHSFIQHTTRHGDEKHDSVYLAPPQQQQQFHQQQQHQQHAPRDETDFLRPSSQQIAAENSFNIDGYGDCVPPSLLGIDGGNGEDEFGLPNFDERGDLFADGQLLCGDNDGEGFDDPEQQPAQTPHMFPELSSADGSRLHTLRPHVHNRHRAGASNNRNQGERVVATPILFAGATGRHQSARRKRAGDAEGVGSSVVASAILNGSSSSVSGGGGGSASFYSSQHTPALQSYHSFYGGGGAARKKGRGGAQSNNITFSSLPSSSAHAMHRSNNNNHSSSHLHHHHDDVPEPPVVAAVIDNRAGDVGIALMPVGTMRLTLAQFTDVACFNQTLAHLAAHNVREVLLADSAATGRLSRALQDGFAAAAQDAEDDAATEHLLHQLSAGQQQHHHRAGTTSFKPVALLAIPRKFFSDTRGARRIASLHSGAAASAQSNNSANVSKSAASNANDTTASDRTSSKRGQQHQQQPASSDLVEITSDSYLALAAANALVEYLQSQLHVIFFPRAMQVVFSWGASGCVSIDRATAKALRLFPSLWTRNGGGERISTVTGTQVQVSEAALTARLDHAVTLCGKRALRRNVLQPPNRPETIQRRQETVAFLALHIDAALMPLRRAFLPPPPPTVLPGQQQQQQQEENDDGDDRDDDAENRAEDVSDLFRRRRQRSPADASLDGGGGGASLLEHPERFPNASLAQHDLEVLLGVFMMNQQPQHADANHRLRVLQLMIGAMLNLRSALAGAQRVQSALAAVITDAAPSTAMIPPLLVEIHDALRDTNIERICATLDRVIDPDALLTFLAHGVAGGGLTSQKLRLAYAFRDLEAEEEQQQQGRQQQGQEQHEQKTALPTMLCVVRRRVTECIDRMMELNDALRERHNVGSLRLSCDARRGFHFVADANEVSTAATRGARNQQQRETQKRHRRQPQDASTSSINASAMSASSSSATTEAATGGLPRDVFLSVHQTGAKITCTTVDLVVLNKELDDAFAEALLSQERLLQRLLGFVHGVIGPLHHAADAVSTLDMLCSLSLHASMSLFAAGAAASNGAGGGGGFHDLIPRDDGGGNNDPTPRTRLLQRQLQQYGVVMPVFSPATSSSARHHHHHQHHDQQLVLDDFRSITVITTQPDGATVPAVHDLRKGSNISNDDAATAAARDALCAESNQKFRASIVHSRRSFRLGVAVPAGSTDATSAATTTTAAIVTGPNASGKTCLLRDIAHHCILAHIGGLLPARYACIPLLDALFLRDAAENASALLASAVAIRRAGGMNNGSGNAAVSSAAAAACSSRFVHDMRETGRILRAATRRSLVLMDEVARGTSSREGAAVAGAVMGHLADRRCLAVMATHHVSLAAKIPARYPNVVALQMEVEFVSKRQQQQHQQERHAAADLVARYGVVKGGCHIVRYGILLAQTARMPRGVIEEALKIHATRGAAEVAAAGTTTTTAAAEHINVDDE